MVGSTSDVVSGAASSPEHALISVRAAQHPEWGPVLRQIGIEPVALETAVGALAGQKLAPVHKLRVLHDLGQLGLLRDMTLPAQALAGDVVTAGRFDELVELASGSLSFGEFVKSVNVQCIANTPLVAAPPADCTDSPTGP